MKYVNLVSYATIFTALFLMVSFFIVSLLPHTFWFNYEDVRPQKQEFSIDEPITFVSELAVYRDVKFKWLDTLRCRIDGENGFIQVSQYSSESGVVEPHPIKESVWRYDSLGPRRPSECFLDTHIEVEVAPLIIKEQDLESVLFTIK